MKPSKNINAKNIPTKGARKSWEPLNTVRPVVLTANMTVGVLVQVKSHATNNIKLLVP